MSIAILIAATIVCAVPLCACATIRWRRRRPLRELRGDWWPSFEQQFHEYVSRGARDRHQTS